MADLRDQRPPAPLVGREAEVATLRSALARVAGGGTPCAVVVAGPAGIGKTRLVQEARAMAADAGLATFTSRADDLSRDVAYAPVVAAFGGLLHALDPADRGRLVGDLPQLGLVFGGLGLPPPPMLSEPDLRRISLLEGITRMVDRLSRDGPLLWALDDVHAADGETRRLLLHLAAALPDRPLLLVLAHRDDDPGTDVVHPLAKGLAESSWQVTRLDLGPLDDAAAVGLATHVLSHPLSDDLAHAVLSRAVGRPLFLESLSQSLLESGSLEVHDGTLSLRSADLPLPADVRQQVRARMAPLETRDRRVLEAVAVAGGPLEHDVLAAVCRLDPRDLGEITARLERRRFLVPVTEESVDLAHGLLRDAVIADLAAATVAALHADLAAARAARDPEDHRLAEHALRAGTLVEPDTAATWLVAAARHARLVGSVRDARRYLDAAVALFRGPRPPTQRTGLVPADLLADLGELCTQLGDYEAASGVWREAAEEYRRLGRPDGLARVHRGIGLLEWTLGCPDDAARSFDAAEAALADLEPGPELGEVLHTRLVAANRVGDLDTLERVSSRLGELAERIGSPGLAVRAHLAAGIAAAARTDYARMAEESLTALGLAEAIEDPELLIRVHDQLSVYAGCAADLPRMRRHSLESLRIAREAGAPTWEPWPRVRIAVTDLLGGDLDAALRGTSEVLGYLTRFPHPRGETSLCAWHALMLAYAGRLKEAHGYLERAHEVAGPALRQDRNIYSIVALSETVVALEEDDPAEARRAGARLLGRGGWVSLLAVATYGEAAVAGDDLEEAQRAIATLQEVVSCDTGLPRVLAAWVAGLTDARAQHATASERLSEARDGFDRLGLAIHRARADLALAQVAAGSEPGGAVPHARAALDAFDRIGMPKPARAARELLRSLGVTPSRGRGRSAGAGPLSARELQVARLVASGMTNAEVATELFISPRTVSTHLDRIYSRLGLSSRAALTRYLADSGLLGGADA